MPSKPKLKLILCIAIPILLTLSAIAGLKFHKAIRVIDGDTIKLENGETVRYIGIDTPETVHPNKPVQYYGKEASEYNRNLVEGKTVYLEYDVQERDKYGRLLAYVFVDDIFVNARLVKEGYARVSTYPPNVKYQDLFLKLEREARENSRGLWSKGKPKTVTTPAEKKEVTVYITRTGAKYHRAGCRYLRRSCYSISKKEAIRLGYTPCKVCRP